MSILKNKLQIFVTLIFLGFVIWWISFQHVVTKLGLSVQWYGSTYAVVALFGAVVGFMTAFKWGGFKTLLGKALIFFSLGLLAQAAGQVIGDYYVVWDHLSTIPYPSWDDAAYFGSVLFYITAALYLAKASGARFSLRHTSYKFVAVLFPVAIVAASYLIILHNHQYDFHNHLSVFLDAGYPIGQALYISIAVVTYLLSRKLMGGIMKSGILLVIAALCIQYLSDFTFLYQSNRGSYVPGKYDDLFYLIAYFAMTIAMIRFHSVYAGLKQKAKQKA
jgi:hypothetical protein